MQTTYNIRQNLGEYLLLTSSAAFLLLAPFYDIGAKYGLIFIYLAFLVKYLSFNKELIAEKFRFRTPLNPGILLFLSSAILSTVFSIKPYHSQKILFGRYLLYLLCFIAGINFIRNNKKERFFEMTFILSGIIVGIGGLTYFLWHSPGRLYFSWDRNVDIGVFSVMYIPFAFFYLTELKRSRMRTLVWLGFCSITACLLLNASRGMLASIILGVFVSLLFFKKSKKGLLSLLIFTCVCVITAFLLKQTRLFDLNTWGFRIPYIKEGLKLFKDSPLIGTGLGSFELLNFTHPAVGRQALHVENLYVEILGQSGIIGLLVFLFLFWSYFKNILINLKNLRTYQLAICASIVSCLISGIFGSVIIVGVPMPFLFWFIFGVSLSEIPKES